MMVTLLSSNVQWLLSVVIGNVHCLEVVLEQHDGATAMTQCTGPHERGAPVTVGDQWVHLVGQHGHLTDELARQQHSNHVDHVQCYTNVQNRLVSVLGSTAKGR